MRLILGSSSPQRKKILEDMGYVFEVIAPEIDEQAIRRENPRELVRAIANAKADAVAGKVTGDAIVIAVDSVVVVHGEIREKPKDAAEALRFLNELSQAVPQTLIAGLVVANTKTGKRFDGVGEASVTFNPIPAALARTFVESGNTFNHAGGFAVQDEAFMPFIREVVGEWETVVGLPKELTRRLLFEVGFSLQS